MKLCLSKSRAMRMGAVYVRGERFVRVKTPHQVSTSGWSRERSSESPFPKGAKTVQAEVGDLAIEMVRAKNGKLVGYSYLAGAAIQLNNYVGKPAHFAPALSSVWKPPEPEDYPTLTPTEILTKLFDQVMNFKYKSAFDVVTLDARVPTHAQVGLFMQMVGDAWRSAPKDMDPVLDETVKVHAFISVEDSEKRGAMLHVQPPRDVSKFGASEFQQTMAIALAERLDTERR